MLSICRICHASFIKSNNYRWDLLFRNFTHRFNVNQGSQTTRRLSSALCDAFRKSGVLTIKSNFLRCQLLLFKIPRRTCINPNGANQFSGLPSKSVPSGWSIVKKMARLVWPKSNWTIRRRVLFAMSLLLCSKLLNVSVPFLFKAIVDHFNDSSNTTHDISLTSIINIGVCLVLAFGCARAGSSLFNELRNAVFAKVAQHSIRSIARSVFLHLHGLDLSFHLNRQTGALSKAIDRGTRGLSFILNALVFNVVPTIVEVGLVTGIFYLKCGPEFAWVTLACVVSYTSTTLAITQWRTKYRVQMNAADSAAGNRAIDSLINYETVKYFNNEQFEADRYDYYLQKYEAASLKTATSLALLNFTQNAIFSTGLVGVMLLAAHGIQNGTMTVGDLVMANTLLFQLSVPLNFLGSVYREIRQGLIDMQTMFSLLGVKSRIQNHSDAFPLTVIPSSSSVSFENVWFGYLPDMPILRGLSMEIPTGKKVAIVGGSGSGKSTIVRLLYRLYDMERGRITIAGQDITRVTTESLRRNIGIVPQESVLFHESILYNLRYGDPAISDERVFEMARTADLHDAVSRMPRGYETIVGERGLKLSGGEKQRLAIARAVLKDSHIVIYDEATSSLDSLTEETILRSLRNAFENKTSLFIAHRLATVVDADIIYVLEGGRIVEKGTHSSLIARPDSLYAKLWQSQYRHVQNRDYSENERKKERTELLVQVELDKCCGRGNCSR